MFSQRIVGSTRVANNLRAAAAAAANTYPITYAWAQRVRSKLKATPYPSRLAHFKHKRTGALANSWAVDRDGKNAVAIVNRANRRGFPYPIIVIGNEQGRRVGRANHPSFARWWLARPLIDEETPELTELIGRDIVDKGNG